MNDLEKFFAKMPSHFVFVLQLQWSSIIRLTIKIIIQPEWVEILFFVSLTEPDERETENKKKTEFEKNLPLVKCMIRLWWHIDYCSCGQWPENDAKHFCKCTDSCSAFVFFLFRTQQNLVSNKIRINSRAFFFFFLLFITHNGLVCVICVCSVCLCIPKLKVKQNESGECMCIW